MFACSEVGLENESEDQAEDGEGFSQRKAEECDRLQDALGFGLTCHAVDVSGEHETNTDTTADCGQTVTYEVEIAFHFIPFKMPSEWQVVWFASSREGKFVGA
jgi:hypothetical protein